MSPTIVGGVLRCSVVAASLTGLMWIPSVAFGQRAITPAHVPAFLVEGIGPGSVSISYQPYGVNDSDVVAGTQISPATQGFIFVKGKVHTVKPPKGAAVSKIFGSDSSNLDVGESCLSSSCDATKALAGEMEKTRINWMKLPAPSGGGLCTHNGCNSVAYGAGSNNAVTGQYGTQATLWLRTAHHFTAKRLPYSNGNRFNVSFGLAVDSFGDVAGVERDAGVTVGAFWPRHGSPFLLPACQTLLVRGGGTFEYPSGILAKGNGTNRVVTVVGKCLVQSPTTHVDAFAPALWRMTIHGSSTNAAAAVRLDANDGSDGAAAVAVNTKGWIVGNQGDAASSATLWIKGRPLLLSTLIPSNSNWSLGQIYALNDKGWITGTGTYSGEQRTFVLKPR